MPRSLNKLSPRAAATLKTPGRHSDGGGLYLSIDAEGRRRWVFMYVRAGKRTELGIGGGRDMPLADARREAGAIRETLSLGGDPKAERGLRKERAPTFGECADDHIKAMKPSWRNAKHAAQWEATLRVQAAPIRDTEVSKISTTDILSVLQPYWQRTPETAKRLQGRLENILDAAKAKGLRTGENPARWRGHLDQLLPKRQRLSRGHHPALPYAEVPAFLAELRARAGAAPLALEFLILTAARTGEVLQADWAEIDRGKALWTVPPARMKGGREHRVPLSGAALRVLAELGDATEGPVFAGPKADAFLSNMALLMLLRRMKRSDLTVHGFRSTFKDWASETTSFPAEVSEMALAHAVGDKVEAAYRRGDLMAKRVALMEAWASHCEPGGENVVDMGAARAAKAAG